MLRAVIALVVVFVVIMVLVAWWLGAMSGPSTAEALRPPRHPQYRDVRDDVVESLERRAGQLALQGRQEEAQQLLEDARRIKSEVQ